MAEVIVSSGVTSTGLVASGTWQEASYIYVRGGTVIETEVDHLGLLHISGGVAYDTVVNHSGEVDVFRGGSASGLIVNSAGLVTVWRGGSVTDTVVNNQGMLILTDGAIGSGNTVNSHGDLFVRSGAIAIDNYVDAYAEVFVADGGVAVDNWIDLRGVLHVSNGGVASNNLMTEHGELFVSEGGSAIHTHVGSSSYMAVYSNGWIGDTTISGGGYLELQSGARTGDRVTLDFTGVSAGPLIYQVLVNDLTLISPDTEICVTGMMTGKTFTLSPVGTDRDVICVNGLYNDVLSAGSSYTNPALGVTYSYDGATITTTSKTIAPVDIAMPLTSRGEIVNDVDLAARWTGTTQYQSSVYLTYGMTEGNGWLEIDGTDVNKALYGTSGGFAGTINWNIKSGTIRNLAAGADAGGSAGAVNLTIGGGDFTGVVYAGGFGNVGGATQTLIADGLFRKDFYAGALSNKLTVATGVDAVETIIAGGTFSGTIYGASAVKTDTTKGNDTRHTAGDVTLTVTGGATTLEKQACIFAGGYATGNATGTVYTVDSVTATISGGSWGTASNGRGVFGGIMASDVEAQVVGEVNLTVSGGSMGNVYGGGWAQKSGAKSIVGDVNINISGGTIANVFGSGNHSTSGGATETGDVTITVSGGDISGAIYARGRFDGDTTGATSVIFTGENEFSCGVYGYSYGGGAAGAVLSFTGYTGTFSGKVGGFDGISFAGATAMTLATAAAGISNGAWEFDLTDRADMLVGTSLLTWSDASFAGDAIKVSFADDAQAQDGWNIATVAEAFSETTFDVEIGGAEIAIGLAYKEQIADGDYAGWGFELESGVLKFKNLA